MQAFLEYVVKSLVLRPGASAITPVERDGATVYKIRLNQTDMGNIIGREGQTINVIRSLLQTGSTRKGQRCSLEVVDENGRERSERSNRPHRDRDRDRRG